MKLEKKVHAVNEVQRLLKANFDHIMPQLEEYVGKKIALKDGGKSSKFKINFLDEQPKGFEGENCSLHRLIIRFNYSLIWLEISCSFKNGDHTCFYEEESLYIGDLNEKEGVLIGLRSAPYEPTINEVGAVRKDIERKKQLEVELTNLKNKISRFNTF